VDSAKRINQSRTNPSSTGESSIAKQKIASYCRLCRIVVRSCEKCQIPRHCSAYIQVIDWFMQNVDLTKEDMDVILSARNTEDMTAINHASKYCGLASVQALLKHPPEFQGWSTDLETCPYYAVASGHSEIADWLFNNGSLANGRIPGRNDTLLHVAVGANQLDTIQVLLRHGADINAPDSRGLTPLMAAAGLRLEDVRVTDSQHPLSTDALASLHSGAASKTFCK